MGKLNTLLSDLAAKSGIDINAEAFKAILKNPALEAIEVPEDFSKPLQETYSPSKRLKTIPSYQRISKRLT